MSCIIKYRINKIFVFVFVYHICAFSVGMIFNQDKFRHCQSCMVVGLHVKGRHQFLYRVVHNCRPSQFSFSILKKS